MVKADNAGVDEWKKEASATWKNMKKKYDSDSPVEVKVYDGLNAVIRCFFVFSAFFFIFFSIIFMAGSPYSIVNEIVRDIMKFFLRMFLVTLGLEMLLSLFRGGLVEKKEDAWNTALKEAASEQAEEIVFMKLVAYRTEDKNTTVLKSILWIVLSITGIFLLPELSDLSDKVGISKNYGLAIITFIYMVVMNLGASKVTDAVVELFFQEWEYIEMKKCLISAFQKKYSELIKQEDKD